MTYAVLDRPCFELVDADDDRHHAPDQVDLDKLLAELAESYGDMAVTVTRLPSPCAEHITCDGCGYQLDEDEGLHIHIVAAELPTELPSYGWRNLGDDQHLCVDCTAQAADATALAAGQRALPGLPGQT